MPSPYDGESLLYLGDAGGNENMQLQLLDLRSGRARLLTDGKSLHGTPVWAHDGKRVAFHGNARDGVAYDIYVVDTTASAAPRLVAAGGKDAWYVQDWSLDDRQLLVQRYASITESALLLVDVETGALTPLVPGPDAKGPVAATQGRFARDGRGVFYLSDNGGEFVELRYLDMFTRESRAVAPQTRWDVEDFDLSNDGRYIAYTLNEAGLSRLVLHDLAQQADMLLPPLPAGAVISELKFDREGKRLALALETAQSPSDIYVLTLGESPPALARWTQSEIGPLDRNALVPAELIRFPTWDLDGSRPRGAVGVRVPAAHAGAASGADRHPWRTRVAVPPGHGAASRSTWSTNSATW